MSLIPYHNHRTEEPPFWIRFLGSAVGIIGLMALATIALWGILKVLFWVAAK